MIVVGLAGQIASGKSEVADVFAQQGAKVISADQIGREVVESSPVVLRRLAAEFGQTILAPSGGLRRKKLARTAFSDPEKTASLNRIIHPLLLKELRRRIRAQRRRRSADILVVDAALIVDWGLHAELDYLIVVESSRERQLARLRRQGLSRRESLDRIRRQAPKYRQRQLADMVIRNNGSLAELRRRALGVCKKLLKSVDKV